MNQPNPSPLSSQRATPIADLVARLLQSNSTEQIEIAAVVGNRAAVRALGMTSTLLTGAPSMIEDAAAAYLTCEECEAALPTYVEAWLAGAELATTFTALHRHLRACPACATQARELYHLLRAETVTAPTHLTFAAARETRLTTNTLWEQQTDQRLHFINTISIHIADAKAHFDNLVAGLTPQLVPVTALRAGTANDLVEVLELPDPTHDLVIRLRMGVLHQEVGALALQFATYSDAQTVTDLKVTLRDEDGTLLESTRSDEDGLAVFDELEAGKYQLQIDRGAQSWVVGVTLHH